MVILYGSPQYCYPHFKRRKLVIYNIESITCLKTQLFIVGPVGCLFVCLILVKFFWWKDPEKISALPLPVLFHPALFFKPETGPCSLTELLGCPWVWGTANMLEFLGHISGSRGSRDGWLWNQEWPGKRGFGVCGADQKADCPGCRSEMAARESRIAGFWDQNLRSSLAVWLWTSIFPLSAPPFTDWGTDTFL